MRLRLHARLRVEDAQSLNYSLPEGWLTLTVTIGRDLIIKLHTQGRNPSKGHNASSLAVIRARVERQQGRGLWIAVGCDADKARFNYRPTISRLKVVENNRM
jgi:hypothetical protein